MGNQPSASTPFLYAMGSPQFLTHGATVVVEPGMISFRDLCARLVSTVQQDISKRLKMNPTANLFYKPTDLVPNCVLMYVYTERSCGDSGAAA